MSTSLRDALPSADTVHTEYNSLVSYVGNIHCRKIQGSWNGHQATQFSLAVYWLQFYSSTMRSLRSYVSHVHVIIIIVNLFNEHVNPTMKFPIMTFKTELWQMTLVLPLGGIKTEVWDLQTALASYNSRHWFNPLDPELNPICYLLALLGAHHFLHVSRIRVKSLTLRRLMSYIYIWSTHSWCF